MPFSPIRPLAPSTPLGPTSPCWPFSPLLPGLPGLPGLPVVPFSPCWPLGPKPPVEPSPPFCPFAPINCEIFVTPLKTLKFASESCVVPSFKNPVDSIERSTIGVLLIELYIIYIPYIFTNTNKNIIC